MNFFQVLALAVSLAAGTAATPVPVKEYMVKLDLQQGDPCGSREAGTLEVLTQPQLLVAEKQKAWFQVGRSVQVFGDEVTLGYRITVTTESLAGGKVRVDGSTDAITLTEGGRDGPVLQTTRTCFRCDVKLGETARVRFGKHTGKETWADLTVEVPVPEAAVGLPLLPIRR